MPKRRRPPTGIAVLALVALAAVIALLSRAGPPPETRQLTPTRRPASRQATVAFCYDGDSFRTTDGHEVRILGIDAPEKGEPFAEQARDLAQKMLKGATVRLEADADDFKTDVYGRTLAYVFVGETDFSERILDAGLARVYQRSSFRRRTGYLQIEQRARRDRKGIWSQPQVLRDSRQPNMTGRASG